MRAILTLLPSVLLFAATVAHAQTDPGLIEVAFGETFEIVADVGAAKPPASWTLLKGDTVVETSATGIFRYRFVEMGAYTLLAKAETSGGSVERSFVISVTPANAPPLAYVPANPPLVDIAFPESSGNSAALGDGELLLLTPVSPSVTPLSIDLDASYDADGDGVRDNDSLGAETYFSRAESSLWIWLPGSFVEKELVVNGPASTQRISVTKSVARTASPSEASVTWIDVSKLIGKFRITEPIADLRAVTTDASGKNVGFYFASGKKKTISVYRNGRLMREDAVETVHDLQKPVVFRMTASGDLLYALHGNDLFVNGVAVSQDGFSFSAGITSVHDEGGVLTFPEGGNVIRYDIKHNVRTVLHRHKGTIEYLRRAGDKIAYVLNDRGVLRMYRNGRRVSPRPVQNPRNFAVNAKGDVYFFTPSARGYALFRNSRSFVTGPGAGAYVDVDPLGRVWHLSYTRKDGETAVRLQRDRSAANMLPRGVGNVELHLAFPDGGYALRAAPASDTSAFSLARDGAYLGEEFQFEYPYNDTHGYVFWDGNVVFRAHDGTRWKAYADGEKLEHGVLRNVWFLRADGDELTVYATK